MANVGPLGIPSIAPLIRENLGLSVTQAGSFLSAYYIGPVLISLPAGWLADRWGVRGAMVLGQALIAIGLFAAAAAPSFSFLLVILVLAGAGYGVLNPTTTKAGMAWFPPRQRATVVGLKQIGLPGGRGAGRAGDAPAGAGVRLAHRGGGGGGRGRGPRAADLGALSRPPGAGGGRARARPSLLLGRAGQPRSLAAQHQHADLRGGADRVPLPPGALPAGRRGARAHARGQVPGHGAGQRRGRARAVRPPVRPALRRAAPHRARDRRPGLDRLRAPALGHRAGHRPRSAGAAGRGHRLLRRRLERRAAHPHGRAGRALRCGHRGRARPRHRLAGRHGLPARVRPRGGAPRRLRRRVGDAGRGHGVALLLLIPVRERTMATS